MPMEALSLPITQVEFLIDESDSVHENKGCGALGEQRWDFVRFMIEKVFRASIQSSYSQRLFVGVGAFANDYMTVVPPTIVSTSIRIASPQMFHDNTDFQKGIRGALNDMYAQPAERRYLVVITDGTFTPNSSHDAVYEELKKQTSDHRDPNLIILIALLCTKNYNDWENLFGFREDIKVFDDLSIVARQLFDRLLDFFPSDTRLFLPADNQDLISIAGYDTSVTFSYWSADASQKLAISDDLKTWSKSLTSGEDFPDDIKALPLCPAHLYRIISLPPTNTWVLLVRPQTFQDLEMKMQLKDGGAVKIVNNYTVDLQFEVRDLLLGKDLGNRANCFTMEIQEVGGGPLTALSCDDLNYLCSSGDALFGENRWNPQSHELGQTVNLTIKFGTHLNTGPTWEGAVTNLPVKLKAVFIFTPKSLATPSLPQEIVNRSFSFSYVASHPDVYLVTIYSPQELSDRGNGLCPNTLTSESGKEFYKVQIHEGGCMPSDAPSGESACISFEEQSPQNYIYTLHAYNYIVSTCGFTQLIFVWEGDENTEVESLYCDVNQMEKGCQ
ncbi:MAG: VWA domain-containing protein [Chloroflexi bacterium]|nr:VWA domain-containing protein [Chloroflexota bacterium]